MYIKSLHIAFQFTNYHFLVHIPPIRTSKIAVILSSTLIQVIVELRLVTTRRVDVNIPPLISVKFAIVLTLVVLFRVVPMVLIDRNSNGLPTPIYSSLVHESIEDSVMHVNSIVSPGQVCSIVDGILVNSTLDTTPGTLPAIEV